MIKIENILEEIEKGYCKESLFLKTDKYTFKELIDKMFENPKEFNGINMFELLTSEDINADYEGEFGTHYTSALSYNGKYMSINWSMYDNTTFGIDNIKFMYFKELRQNEINVKKYIYVDEYGNEIYSVVKKTIFNSKGNFINRNINIKNVISSLNIKLKNNIVISFDRSVFSGINGINKIDLTSDLVIIYFATMLSYKEKKDFFTLYNKFKDYKDLD